MKNLFYWVGLPMLFVVLVAATFLIPKTYESRFVVTVEDQLSIEQNRVMTLNRPENYDLGVMRTDNMLNRYSYEEIILSDTFIRELMEMPVKTVDGLWEGSYYDYVLKDSKPAKDIKIDSSLVWVSRRHEAVARNLKHAIDIEVDYETCFVTICCKTEDPLVSQMLAKNIESTLRRDTRAYQLEKMELTLRQLEELTVQAKAEWEKDKTAEKEHIWKSFARQELVYKAQMMYVPAFTTLSEPSFSYRKVSPNRWKIPFVITLLLGIGFWCYDNKEKVKQYILG